MTSRDSSLTSTRITRGWSPSTACRYGILPHKLEPSFVLEATQENVPLGTVRRFSSMRSADGRRGPHMGSTLHPRRWIGRIILLVWAPLAFVAAATLGVAHWRTLPKPDTHDESVRTA